MFKRFFTLQNLRRIYSVFFLVLFIVLVGITDFRNMKGYEVSFFLELDPLVAISTFMTSGVLYKGLALSLIIIVGTLIFGRFFCSWVCPLGILNHWTGYLFNRRRPVDDYKVNAYRSIYRLKYYLLVILIVAAVFGSLQTGLFDPISLLTRTFTLSVYPAINQAGGTLYIRQPVFYGGGLVSLLFIALLFSNRFITRFWCRVLCPLGAMLGLFAGASLLRIRRDIEKCNDCQKCLRHCQGGCDPHAGLRVSECMKVCPTNVIQPALLESGFEGLWTPILMNSIGYCEHNCVLCGQVCPTGAITPLTVERKVGKGRFKEPIKIGTAFYDRGRCLPWAMNTECIVCEEVCPTSPKAIWFETVEITDRDGSKRKLKKPHLDPKLCIGCGICENKCPVQDLAAIRVTSIGETRSKSNQMLLQ